MIDARVFCITSAGGFFLTGLLSGAWKYSWIARTASSTAQAPAYVDIAHRASLLYAFARHLLAELCARSAWPNSVNVASAIVMVSLFASAVFGYVLHGALRDTDNQLRRPHRLGKRTIPAGVMTGFMIMLTVGEIGGF